MRALYRTPPASASPIEVIKPGQSIPIGNTGDAIIRDVTQRNWSRVGVAECNGERFFLKQFVDRVSRWHRRGFDGDARTLASLGEKIAGVRVLPTLHRDNERLLIVSPLVEMTTIDSINRSDVDSGEIAKRIGAAIAGILRERSLPGDPTQVATWKGLDPKNIGWSDDGTLWIFDFGPSATLDRDKAAALAVAAGLLSRWVARPGIHLLAPERRILQGVCMPASTMTTLIDVQEALRHHQQLRLREPQRLGMARTATRLGLRTLGRVHWLAVNREAERLFDATQDIHHCA